MASTGVQVPKYYWLKQKLLAMIESAEPGSALPTERALAEQFETSRTTVRQALAELTLEGRLERTQGRGTFVSSAKPIAIRQLTSFSEDLAARGIAAHNEIVDVTRTSADREVAEALGLPAGSFVNRVERIRHAGGAPLAHEIAHLPGSLPRLRAELARRGSLYRTLREAYRIEIAAVEDSVQTALADPTQAQLLGCDTGLPMLLVCRTSWDKADRRVEFTRSVFRGDRFRFVARGRVTSPA